MGCDGRVRGKDAGSANSSAIGATEDAAPCRPARPSSPVLIVLEALLSRSAKPRPRRDDADPVATRALVEEGLDATAHPRRRVRDLRAVGEHSDDDRVLARRAAAHRGPRPFEELRQLLLIADGGNDSLPRRSPEMLHRAATRERFVEGVPRRVDRVDETPPA